MQDFIVLRNPVINLKRFLIVLGVFLSLVISLQSVTALSAGAEENSSEVRGKKKVLLVHSYHPEFEWVADITDGVKSSFENDDSIELKIFYMDTKRNTGEDWKVKKGEEARDLVFEWEPDVIIPVDDNAQEYFAAKYFLGDEKYQIVFCGVNEDPSLYNYPAENATGILQHPHFEKSLDFVKKFYPDLQNIAIVSDNSPTSTGAIESMMGDETEFSIVSSSTPLTMDEWKSKVLEAQESADAIATYTYHTVKEKEDSTESMNPADVMAWTVENSEIPVVGFLDFTMKDGAFGGYIESGFEQGFRAGEIALEILSGKSAKDFPLVTALEGESMLNLKTAGKLGVTIPEDIMKTIDIVVEE